VLNPTFLPEQISQIDSSSKLSRAYDGSTYLPGKSVAAESMLWLYSGHVISVLCTSVISQVVTEESMTFFLL